MNAWDGLFNVVNDWPPNIAAIREVFPLTGNEIFAHGDVYNPGGGLLSDALIAHECVHLKQQAGDPGAWWDRYIDDGPFRFQQELEAHQEEFTIAIRGVKDRNRVNEIRSHIAHKLAAPLYGQMISYRKAMSLLT